jgi:nicotinate-nucleotide pyrophosphorylase (carboxylating)
MSATDLHPPLTAVRDAVARALAEDLEPLGDVTAALLPPDVTATAALVARADGVVAGRLAAEEAFARVDARVAVSWHLDDGAVVAPGDVIAEVSGPLASILTAERTALNFLGHLSGVASLTARYVAAAGEGVRIWDTRKTTPGLRALEKAAVRAGGGANHRGNLSEWVLLKDNHLTGLGITEAVRRARERWPVRVVEVEADRLDQVVEAIAAGADLVLLDNMSPDEVRACVAARGEATRPLLEVSGRINLETVASYGDTGVDLISVGALTHSAPVLDIGLDIAD